MFQAVWMLQPICSPISLNVETLRPQPQGHRSLLRRQMWPSHSQPPRSHESHWLTEKLRGPLETAPPDLGKIERWHQTLKRFLANSPQPFDRSAPAPDQPLRPLLQRGATS